MRDAYLVSRRIQDALHPVVRHDEHGRVGNVHQNGGEVRCIQRAKSLILQDGAESDVGTGVETQLHPLLHHIQRRHDRIVGDRCESAGDRGGIRMHCGEEAQIDNGGYVCCPFLPDRPLWTRKSKSTMRGRGCTRRAWETCLSKELSIPVNARAAERRCTLRTALHSSTSEMNGECRAGRNTPPREPTAARKSPCRSLILRRISSEETAWSVV